MRKRVMRTSRLSAPASVALSVLLAMAALGIGAEVANGATDRDTITVWRLNPKQGITSDLTLDDAKAIEEQVANVASVWPKIYKNTTVRHGETSAEARVHGAVELSSGENRDEDDWQLDRGASITQQDGDQLAQVVLLGAANAKELFSPGVDPLGRQILIGNHLFRVKGILKKRLVRIRWASRVTETEKAEMVTRSNRNVFVPFQTGVALSLFGSEKIWGLEVVVKDSKRIGKTKRAVRDLLTQRHGSKAFSVWIRK